MEEPFTNFTAIDEIEPVIQRTDAIAELAEQLSFAFSWILDARDSKAVALRVYVSAHFFCPTYINHETLTNTGKRLGVTRQAVSKLSSELRDLLDIRPADARSDSTRVGYQKSQYGNYHHAKGAVSGARKNAGV
jgi:hypothetical protein